MAIGSQPFANSSGVKCERCGNNLAACDVVIDDLTPPVRLLLCHDCADTELGRRFLDSLRPHITPPLPEHMSDEEVRRYFRGFRDDPRNWP